MADQEKKQYLSEDEMGFGAAAKAPKYLSESDMGFGKSASPLRRVADIPVALAKGVVGAGEAAVGLADLATGGQAGKALHDATGYDPKATKEFLDEQYSPQQKEAKAKVDQATGFVGKAKAMLENPSTIGEAVVESAPLMLGGGAVAQGLGKATKLGAVARSALGEGVVGAGSSAEGIRQETPEGTLDGKQSLAALGTGAGTAAITAASGGIARKLGISDLDTQLATRGGVAEGLANTSTKGRARRLGEGALTEGVLEEMPQSGLEQGLQNVALDKPIGEGVPEAMAAGMLTGAAMGGPLAAAPATAKIKQQPEQPPATENQPAATATAPAPAPILDAQAMERAGVMPPPVLDDEQIRKQVDLESGAPIPFTPTPAEELAAQRKAAMGIDPAAGPLSAGAAIAVETQAAEEVRLGAAAMLAEGAARAQQAQAERAAWEAANPGIPYEPVTAAPASNQPTPSAAPSPSGSFGAMNDFAELLSQERQDVAQRRAGIAERQGQRRDFDLAEADRRTAESMQREAQARRRAVLDSVLADPETKNPAGRFAAMLRREGYRDSAPTEDELRTIQRFEDVRAAQPAPPEVEPSAPNELDPAALGIRERRPPPEKQVPAPPRNLREGMARAQAARAAEGGSAPTAGQPSAAQSFDPGKAWAGLNTQQRADLAGRLQGVPPIVSKNVPRAEWGKINPALRAKLAEVMQPRGAGQDAIDSAAHEAATSPRNDRAQPTEAQAKAGNYKKGHVSIGGLDIAIENPEGSTRSGIDPGGKPWSVTMSAHYGYVKRTQGADGDQVDVYLGKADPVSGPVFVVDQFDSRTGKFDEHKAILGAKSLKEAQALYDAHFSDGKGPERRGAITSMSFDAFKDWAKNGNTKAPLGRRTAAPSASVQAPNIPQENPNGATRPDSAEVAAGRDSQGSLDARGVVDHGADGGSRAAGAENGNTAAEPSASGPSDGAGVEVRPADQESSKNPTPAPPSVGEAPSQLEALFSDLNSDSTRKANKARKAAAKLPEAARIEYVQANFHDLLIQLMDSGKLEVNGVTTLTEDNASCL